mgnify:CR=1 FL=1
MMKDLLELLGTAKEHYCFQNLDEFRACICSLVNEVSDSLPDWDEGAGEAWGRVYTRELCFMIHCSVGIVFVRSNRDSFYIPASIAHLTVVPVESFDAEEWFMDIEQLQEKVPEIVWHTSKDVVDPMSFCLSELYYATI